MGFFHLSLQHLVASCLHINGVFIFDCKEFFYWATICSFSSMLSGFMMQSSNLEFAIFVIFFTIVFVSVLNIFFSLRL